MFRVWACVALVVLGATVVGLRARAEDDSAAEVKKKQDQMLVLSKETKAGTYYNTAQVPADLDGFRSQMLAVGNLGRRDPDFRKKNGAKVATDLRGATVIIGPGDEEKIFKNQETPPYFKDLVLNDALNKAAQFQAEYQASTDKLSHTGPDSFEGDSMKQPGDRAKHFGYTFQLEGEGCSAGDATSFPIGLMTNETHFRPWFNIGHDVREMGLGIAKGASGTWYGCAVPGLGDPAAAARKSERRGPPPPAKKNPPPKNVSPPPPPKKVIPPPPKKEPPPPKKAPPPPAKKAPPQQVPAPKQGS